MCAVTTAGTAVWYANAARACPALFAGCSNTRVQRRLPRLSAPLTCSRHRFACGSQIFCEECSAKTCAIPQFGMNTPVRVCDDCFITIKRTNFDFNV